MLKIIHRHNRLVKLALAGRFGILSCNPSYVLGRQKLWDGLKLKNKHMGWTLGYALRLSLRRRQSGVP
jgi:hypothetical protein